MRAEVVTWWPGARHPHQTPEWYETATGRAWAVRADVDGGGVILPVANPYSEPASAGYGGPIAWGTRAAQLYALEEVVELLDREGVGPVHVRCCPTEPCVLDGFLKVEDLGPTVVIPVRDSAGMWAALHRSVRRDVARAQNEGLYSIATSVTPAALELLRQLQAAQFPDLEPLDADLATRIAAVVDAKIVVVWSRLEVAAAQLVVTHGGVAEAWAAASAPAYRHLAPLKMADWTTLVTALDDRAAWVHVGGAARREPDGLLAYKRRLGGEERADHLATIETGGSGG